METQFQESTVKSLWVKIAGRLWRAWYRIKSKARREFAKTQRRADRLQNRARIYRVEIR